MRCEKIGCGNEAQGRVVFECFHGRSDVGFGGYLALAGPWSCGTHEVPQPEAAEADYFVARFRARSLDAPAELTVVPGFVRMNETQGRRLEHDPELLYRQQVEGEAVTIEPLSPKEWAKLEKDAAAARALHRGLKGAV